MLEKLISSGVRLALLKRFILHPGKEFYLRQLSSELGFNVMTVREELINLCSTGLIRWRKSGNRKYFRIDKNHLLFPELGSLIVKTIGVVDVLKEYMSAKSREIEFSFIYGSIASGAGTSESDIDLFVIGDLSPRELSPIVRNVSDELGREVNCHTMKKEEFTDRLRRGDHFVNTIMREPKILLKGNEDELRELGS